MEAKELRIGNWAIIEKNCKPYGGFVNVITNCGGSLVSQIWIKSMEEYAVRFLVDLATCKHHYVPVDAYWRKCSHCGMLQPIG